MCLLSIGFYLLACMEFSLIFFLKFALHTVNMLSRLSVDDQFVDGIFCLGLVQTGLYFTHIVLKGNRGAVN